MTCKCEVCEETSSDVIDGVCEKCEPKWFEYIEELAKVLPKQTPLDTLLKLAAIKTRDFYRATTK